MLGWKSLHVSKWVIGAQVVDDAASRKTFNTSKHNKAHNVMASCFNESMTSAKNAADGLMGILKAANLVWWPFLIILVSYLYSLNWKADSTQSSAIIMQYNIVGYNINDYRKWGWISARCWIHRRHPIPGPNGQPMQCHLWIFLRNFRLHSL